MDRGRQTTGTYQLDLTEEAWPLCLLKFKSQLDRVEAGRFLEVMVADPDVLDSLDKILRHDAGRIIQIEKEQDRYRILIQRQGSAVDRS
jgi:TusA-related sulfurtransferase